MERAFVDTSAWIALADRRDPRRPRLEDWFRTRGARFVTSSDIFDEAVTFATSRWGHGVACQIGAAIRDNPEVHFVHVAPEFQEAAWTRFRERTDKGYSLTDCTSFVIMERMGIDEVATLDHHFEQEGFRVVP